MFLFDFLLYQKKRLLFTSSQCISMTSHLEFFISCPLSFLGEILPMSHKGARLILFEFMKSIIRLSASRVSCYYTCYEKQHARECNRVFVQVSDYLMNLQTKGTLWAMQTYWLATVVTWHWTSYGTWYGTQLVWVPWIWGHGQLSCE